MSCHAARWLVGLLLVQSARGRSSPCSELISFSVGREYEGSFGFRAIIGLDQIVIKAEVAVKENPPTKLGRIVFDGDQKDFDDVYKMGGTLWFKIGLMKLNPLPIVTKLMVNDVILCSSLDITSELSVTRILRYQLPSRNAASNPVAPTQSTSTRKGIVPCGIPSQKTHITPLIVGGLKKTILDWPWLAALLYKENANLDYFCAGTLINVKMVATAAHCMELDGDPRPPEKIVVRLGSTNPVSPGDNTVDSFVKGVYTHPGYNSKLHNDIAILVIDKVKYSNSIKPICLWGSETNQNHIYKQTGTVVGWGKDENDNTVTKQPREVSVPIVSDEECKAIDTNYHDYHTDSNFCAGTRNGRGPCNGDSGGGLYLHLKGRWVLRGITSSILNENGAVNCQLNKFYVLFTDVSKYTSWIASLYTKD